MIGGNSCGGDGANNIATDSDGNCGTINATGTMPVMSTSLKLKDVNNVARLKDITKYLKNTYTEVNTNCPYDSIIEMIRRLNLHDDGIQMNHKIKLISSNFCAAVQDENMLRESITYINDKALCETQLAKKFAVTFAAHQFDELAIGETRLRSEMLNILNRNYLDADVLRQQNRQRFYNSIMLLGEYYQRVRLQNDTPIDILGQALLELLINEISDTNNANDIQLSKLILTQISINGDILRGHRQDDLIELLYLIRRNIIEQDNLQRVVKALSLMTLDTYYMNLCSLGKKLEGMYMKYYIMVENGEVDVQEVKAEDADDGERNFEVKDVDNKLCNIGNNTENEKNFEEQVAHVQNSIASSDSNFLKEDANEINDNQTQHASNLNELNNGCNTDSAVDVNTENNIENHVVDEDQKTNGLYDYCSTKAKWSDDVWNDDAGIIDDFCVNTNGLTSAQKSPNGSHVDRQNNVSYYNEVGDNSDDGAAAHSCKSRQSYRSVKSPRSLKYVNSDDDGGYGNTEVEECDDDKKPLPRWRVTRFNRNNNEYKGGIKTKSNSHKNNKYHNQQRLDSLDDDIQYSKGGDDEGDAGANGGSNIRLYSVNDRLKYAQEKIERNTNRNQYNGLATSNWDCQSQRDDRSERSYQSNYERGHSQHQQRRSVNSKGRGNVIQRNGNNNNERRYNNWNAYEKPPRFQKQQRHPMNNHNYNQNNDGRIVNESWRQRSHKFPNENDNDGKKGKLYNKSCESGAQTLPRPSKPKHDNNYRNYDASDNDRRSYSPAYYETSNRQQHGNGGRRKMGQLFGNRYNSQNSLANETINTDHSNQYGQSKQQTDHQNNGDMDDTINKEELLCATARQTTKYMKYLSTKK